MHCVYKNGYFFVWGRTYLVLFNIYALIVLKSSLDIFGIFSVQTRSKAVPNIWCEPNALLSDRLAVVQNQKKKLHCFIYDNSVAVLFRLSNFLRLNVPLLVSAWG